MKLRNAGKIMCSILAVSMILGLPCTANAVKKAKPRFARVTLEVGQKKKITIKNRKSAAKYTYKSSAPKKAAVNKSGVISAIKAGKVKITVKEQFKKRTAKCGTVTVTVKNKKTASSKPVVTTVVPVISTTAPTPAQSVQTPVVTTQPPVATGVPTAEPTAEPTAVVTSTPDVYTKEVMTLDVTDTKVETVDGNTCDVAMQFFTGTSSSDYFTGNVKNESTTTIKAYHEGNKYYSARYILTGTDDAGKACNIFVEDNGIQNKDGSMVSRPIIFTNSASLSWLETADLQGRVEEVSEGNKKIHIMWNESNTVPVTPPPVVRPDATKKYDKEIFKFKIDIGDTSSDNVEGKTGKGSMIHFRGSAVGDSFTGTIVSDCSDTRKQFNGQTQTLSARYIIEGKDSNGNACRVFVENNGIDENGVMTTEPIIISDNPDFAWIETAPLHGTTSSSGALYIHMWTTSD